MSGWMIPICSQQLSLSSLCFPRRRRTSPSFISRFHSFDLSTDTNPTHSTSSRSLLWLSAAAAAVVLVYVLCYCCWEAAAAARNCQKFIELWTTNWKWRAWFPSSSSSSCCNMRELVAGWGVMCFDFSSVSFLSTTKGIMMHLSTDEWSSPENGGGLKAAHCCV